LPDFGQTQLGHAQVRLGFYRYFDEKLVIFAQIFGHWPSLDKRVWPQKIPKYLAFLALWSKTQVFFY